MQMQFRFETVMRALADELTSGWSARLGGVLTLSAGGSPAGQGWMVTVPASGAATGRLIVWFERESLLVCARRALAAGADPTDETIEALLRELVEGATTRLEATAAGAGLNVGAAVMRQAPCPSGAQPFVATLAEGPTCRFAIVGDLVAAPVDTRLEAVLDVELPLVVRFGRAVMPLGALAELGPGAVVDMGRSPDEPVELLVGERVVARGEVVIVGGNYGVRITELAGDRALAGELEARAS
jgi:flagellar motor switch protein FliN/FliY